MLGSLLPRRRASEELPRPLFPPAVNPVSAVWQWQSEAGWHCFDPVQCEALETARASGNTRLTLRSGKWMYNIDLGNMLQQNVMTRRMRHVRRIMEEVPLWFREGADAEEAVRYDPELEAALESSYAALVEQLGNDPPGEAAVSLTVWTGSDGLDYEADVEEMTECCRSTGVVRKICRSVLRVRPSVGESDAPDGCEAETAFQLPSLAVGTAESGECWCRGHLRVVGANDLDDVLIPVAASEAVEDVCAICLDSLGSTSSPGDSSAPMRGTLDHASAPQSEAADGVVKLKKCMHMYHDTCVRTYVGRGGRGGFSCPTCGTLQCAGNGPSPKGRMRWRIGEESLLAGYPHSGTISIEYDVPSGIQSERHQHPAVPFMGTKRTAYLPDTREGREVLILFIHAFVKGHMFTVGTSVTSGRSDVVIWNGIHHKTSRSGGPTAYGYPDASYFQRVLGELKAKGITWELARPVPVDHLEPSDDTGVRLPTPCHSGHSSALCTRNCAPLLGDGFAHAANAPPDLSSGLSAEAVCHGAEDTEVSPASASSSSATSASPCESSGRGNISSVCAATHVTPESAVRRVSSETENHRTPGKTGESTNEVQRRGVCNVRTLGSRSTIYGVASTSEGSTSQAGVGVRVPAPECIRKGIKETDKSPKRSRTCDSEESSRSARSTSAVESTKRHA